MKRTIDDYFKSGRDGGMSTGVEIPDSDDGMDVSEHGNRAGISGTSGNPSNAIPGASVNPSNDSSGASVKLPAEETGDELDPFDEIGIFYHKIKEDPGLGLTTDEDFKERLISSRIPDQTFVFPERSYKDTAKKSGVRVRKCQREWLLKNPTIAYSKTHDGLFCLACVLFPVPARHGKNANILISEPLNNWKKAIEALTNHSRLEYHRISEAKFHAFTETKKDPTRRIDFSMSAARSQLIEKNRMIMKSVIKCIELCGRMEWALRGHRDNGLLTAYEDFTQGNFKTLLKFRIDSGDSVLKEHFESCSKTAQYCSKTIQNDVLNCIAKFIQTVIVDEIKAQPIGPKYGLQADEVTDISNKEQMGIVVRYTKDCESVERLLAYSDCDSIAGAALSNNLIETLTGLGLSPADCRAQTYDGAANMSGEVNGCAAKFREVAPNAPYYHCINHDLNLAISKAADVVEINCMLNTITEVGIFFKYSPKRQNYFHEQVMQYNCTAVHKIPVEKVKLLCATRWSERHTSLFDFDVLIKPLATCLSKIVNKDDADKKWDTKTITDANGLLCRMSTSAFVVSFQTAKYLFGFTSSLATSLQGTTQDIVRAYKDVGMVLDMFKDIRENCDNRFEKLFGSKIASMADMVDVEISIPRRCKKQTLRGNVEADNPQTYWRRTIFVPYLDRLVTQLSSRFTSFQKDAVISLNLIPENVRMIDDTITESIIQKFHAEVPQPQSLSQELEMWQRVWIRQPHASSSLPKTVTETLRTEYIKGFPNICYILHTLLLIPVSAASVERSHSALKLVKTKLRSTMLEDRMNALVLLAVHKDIILNYDTIVNDFANKFPRRMLLIHPLTESEEG